MQNYQIWVPKKKEEEFFPIMPYSYNIFAEKHLRKFSRQSSLAMNRFPTLRQNYLLRATFNKKKTFVFTAYLY